MIISVVLPCYNPHEGWEQTVYNNYISFCARAQIQAELLLVIDGADAAAVNVPVTFLKAKIPSLNLIQYSRNRGKGYAIRQGVKAATGDIIIYTDIDFPYTEDSFYKLYEALKNDQCDVAVGVKDEQYYTHVPFLRKIISHALRFFIRLLLSIPITDTQCGLKGFRKNAAPLFLETTINRYLFDLEFIRNCFKDKRYRINPIPVTLKENILFSEMNYRILFSESVNFLKLLFSR